MVLDGMGLSQASPGALGHIIAASFINVIGAVFIARIMIPSIEDTTIDTVGDSLSYSSNMDAITRGTSDGLRLVVNVGAILIVLVSLVALINQLLGVIDVADAPLTLERMMGWVFSPVAWLIGIPWQEAQTAGSLLGTKLILNELVAYLQLAALPEAALSAEAVPGPSSLLLLVIATVGLSIGGWRGRRRST